MREPAGTVSEELAVLAIEADHGRFRWKEPRLLSPSKIFAWPSQERSRR